MNSINEKLGSKIVVVGSSGSGKTTFAKKFSRKTAIPLYELDFYRHKENWEETFNEEFRGKIDEITCQNKWVIDGNYFENMDFTIGRADSIIWLDYSLIKSLYRVIKRTFVRLWTQEPLWHNNKQSFKITFSPKDSIILYSLKTHKRKKMAIEAIVNDKKFQNIKWIRIKNSKDEINFWMELEKKPD